MTQNYLDLDVRPILRKGEEPFEKIMGAIGSLEPGQGLRLFATFKPVPLFRVLGAKGFSHEARELGDGDWEVLFSPEADQPHADEQVVQQTGEETANTWPEPVHHLDNRDLEPPEPMVRILATTETMSSGEVLSALLCREPMFLFPELAKRGHAWRGTPQDDGTYSILVRVGAAQPVDE